MKPWEQLPEESDAAYGAARLFFEAGPNRSLLGATRDHERAKGGPKRPRSNPDAAPTGPSGTIKRWAKQFHWRERARAFDENLNRVGDNAREAARVDQATQLEQRRLKISETEWLVSQKIMQRIAEMLSFPLSTSRTETTTSPDGRVTHTTTIMPLTPDAWRLRDVATLARIGVDLQRMSVGMPTRMAVQPIASSGSEATPVDQTQADADNGRIPPELAEVFREEAARIALENAGLDDVQPDW